MVCFQPFLPGFLVCERNFLQVGVGLVRHGESFEPETRLHHDK